jgi:hypothetical protein
MELKKKLCKCGCNQMGYYWKSGYLKGHHPDDTKKPIKKVSEKGKVKMKESNNYYRMAIGINIVKNKGKCICEECGEEILSPCGRNCSHIVGAGANKSLYHDIINHKILCLKCENIWTNMDKTKMSIYKECEEIRILLNNKHYSK